MPHPRRRCFLIMIGLVAVLAAGFIGWRLCRPPALYRMTILPTLGGRNTHAFHLNDHGQVIGIVYDMNGHTRFFLWDRTHGIQDLGFASECHGLIINNAGQIAGTMPTDPNCHEAFLWDPGKDRTMLGTLGGKRSYPIAMNNRGQVTGLSLDANDFLHAFLWDKETGMEKLPIPDGVRCIPQSINDAGQILVMAIKQPLALPGPWFLLDPNGSKRVDTILPATWLRNINASSCMAATERSSGSSLPRLLLRDKQGIWRRLFPLNSHGQTTRLNDRNQIAYTEQIYSRWEPLRKRLPRWLVRPRPPAFEAVSYLWDPTRGRIPLNRYLRGIEGFYVEDLNNNGCIVGKGHVEDGNLRSVLLEPIPERWGE